MASLLADSYFVEKLPEDMEIVSGLEIGTCENVASSRFSLDWFNDNEGGGSRDGQGVRLA